MDVSCPYCGEWIELEIDEGGGPVQHYIEDCQVCCRPMVVVVEGEAVSVRRQDE